MVPKTIPEYSGIPLHIIKKVGLSIGMYVAAETLPTTPVYVDEELLC
jgi:hypothetical protein